MPTLRRIELRQGKTWQVPILWQDSDGVAVDLSAAACRMQMRARWADDEPTATPLLDLTEADGITLSTGLTPSGAPYNILTEVSAAVTETIPAGLYLAEWEIILTGGEGPESGGPLLEVLVTPEVVRDTTPT